MITFINWVQGHIPDGTTVQFKSDEKFGRVVNGNNKHSLVDYMPDRLSDGSEARDWFSNDTLKVPAGE